MNSAIPRTHSLASTAIVMPHHLDGIVAISDIVAGGSRTAPTRNPPGRLVGAFKTVSTKHLNEIRGTLGAMIWQRNFHEHWPRILF